MNVHQFNSLQLRFATKVCSRLFACRRLVNKGARILYRAIQFQPVPIVRLAVAIQVARQNHPSERLM